jgi:hypothetical protein
MVVHHPGRGSVPDRTHAEDPRARLDSAGRQSTYMPWYISQKALLLLERMWPAPALEGIERLDEGGVCASCQTHIE